MPDDAGGGYTTIQRGIARSSVGFNHFPTKQHLLREIAEGFLHTLLALLEAARREGGTTAQQLERFFALVATDVERGGPKQRTFVMEVIRLKSGSRSHRFVLRGLLLVVGLAGLASIAHGFTRVKRGACRLPRAVRCAVDRLLAESTPRAGDSPVVRLLDSLVTAESLFREGDKDKNGVLDYSTSLSQLGSLGLIDPGLASGTRDGYVFTILPSTNVQFDWSAVADPEVAVSTAWHFFTDESGVIRAARGRTAGATDPPALTEAELVANQMAAVGSLRTLVTAQSLFREGDKDKNGILDYSASLSQLATLNLIDLNFASSPDENGYVFMILPSTNIQFHWSAVADPEQSGVTGTRHYFVDESGVIRYARGRAAGPSDPSVD